MKLRVALVENKQLKQEKDTLASKLKQEKKDFKKEKQVLVSNRATKIKQVQKDAKSEKEEFVAKFQHRMKLFKEEKNKAFNQQLQFEKQKMNDHYTKERKNMMERVKTLEQENEEWKAERARRIKEKCAGNREQGRLKHQIAGLKAQSVNMK